MFFPLASLILVTGYCAFTHKAGIHAKAILNNPSTYEILNPADFGMTRYVSIGHRLTGWNAVKNRVQQLGLELDDEQVKLITQELKTLADIKVGFDLLSFLFARR